MKPSYRFLDHTADVLFEAEAGTLNGLFEQCALAVEDTQVELKKVKQNISKMITERNTSVEKLLFDFLDDLIFYKDAELLVFSKFTCLVEKKGEAYHLSCTALGDVLDHKKHEPKVDVKAITMHLFEVKENKGRWTAKVLLDI